MDEFGTTSDNRGQADEEIFTPTLSDEALEAAASGREEEQFPAYFFVPLLIR